MGHFGNKAPIFVTFGPVDAAGAIDRVLFIFPADLACDYQLAAGKQIWTTASSSGTIRPRVIRSTSTEAPGASASATCIELAAAVGCSATANTPLAFAPVAGVLIHPGDRLAIDAGGTMTSLVGLVSTLEFVPVGNAV